MKIVAPLSVAYNAALESATPVLLVTATSAALTQNNSGTGSTGGTTSGGVDTSGGTTSGGTTSGGTTSGGTTTTTPPSTGGDILLGGGTVVVDTTTFSAALTQGPVDGATLNGVVTLVISGNNIQNAELLPEFGYTPKYGIFTLSADRKTATLSWDTNQVTDTTQKFRISAFNQPPNTTGATEIVVTTRSWTIKNSTTPVAATGSIGYYGGSSILGYLQGGGQANPTPVQTFATSLTTPTIYNPITNHGVSGQGTGRLLAGGYGGADSLETQLQTTSSGETVCILNHLLNDADPFQENNSTATYDANLRTIIGLFRKYGKKIVFETPQPVANFPIADYLTVMKNVAATYGVPIIDVNQYLTDYMAANSLTIYDICPDGEHPNQSTYDLKGRYSAAQFKPIEAAGFVATTSTGTGTTSTSSIVMAGPNAASFTANPTLSDDFDGTKLSNKWNLGDWLNAGPNSNMLRVNNGMLEMTGDPSNMFTGSDRYGYCIIDTDPTTGKGAAGGFKQRYGVFQIECKLPAGKGYWPAFWFFDHTGNHRPEIDMFECYAGGSFDWTAANGISPQKAATTIHPNDDNGGGLVAQAATPTFNISNSADLSSDFHTYTMEWDATYMKFYLDKVLVQTITNADTMAWFSQFSLYVMIQLGINYSVSGGPSSDPNITPRGWGTSGVMQVKSVAVWQWNKYV